VFCSYEKHLLFMFPRKPASDFGGREAHRQGQRRSVGA